MMFLFLYFGHLFVTDHIIGSLVIYLFLASFVVHIAALVVVYKTKERLLYSIMFYKRKNKKNQ